MSDPAGPERPAPATTVDRDGLRAQVFGVDEQHDEPVDLDRWVQLAERVLDDQGVRGDAELSLLFVDEATMTELNQHHMDEDGPTDVLAFPIDDEPQHAGRWPDSGSVGPDRQRIVDDDLPVLLGDVVICPSIAARNAPDHAGTYVDEVALLVVHGILHVLGWDHADAEQETAMRRREQELLDRHHRDTTP